jgi:hypothetical protein
MTPDPEVLARLAAQRAAEPDDLGLGHQCDDLCRPTTTSGQEAT